MFHRFVFFCSWDYILQLSSVAPPPLCRNMQPNGSNPSMPGFDNSARSTVNSIMQAPRRKFVDEGKLRKVKSSNTAFLFLILCLQYLFQAKLRNSMLFFKRNDLVFQVSVVKHLLYCTWNKEDLWVCFPCMRRHFIMQISIFGAEYSTFEIFCFCFSMCFNQFSLAVPWFSVVSCLHGPDLAYPVSISCGFFFNLPVH